jgi:hypothetical protein
VGGGICVVATGEVTVVGSDDCQRSGSDLMRSSSLETHWS